MNYIGFYAASALIIHKWYNKALMKWTFSKNGEIKGFLVVARLYGFVNINKAYFKLFNYDVLKLFYKAEYGTHPISYCPNTSSSSSVSPDKSMYRLRLSNPPGRRGCRQYRCR